MPPISTYRRAVHIFSVFLLGMIIGSVVYNSIYHRRYNNIWLENKELQIKLTQCEENMKTFKKYMHQQSVIKEIIVRIEQSSTCSDLVAMKEMKKKVGQELEVLRGRNMYHIAEYSKMTRSMLNDKTYTVREKQYTIQVKTMLVIEGVLQVWVDIRPCLLK